ncbi:MAG: OmpA family protein [Pseudomonadota bacterium]
MKRFLLSGAAVALVAMTTQTAHAEDSSKEEATGVGAGLVIGAAAGGPPGAIVGAAIGALIGDRLHKSKEEIVALDTQLEGRNTTIDTLSGELASQRREARQMREELTIIDSSGARELHVLLNKGLTFTVPYRTDDSTLPIEVEQRLGGIAALLASTPGLSVQIDGYADPRGSDAYNEELSLARADNVKALLTSAGLSADRIEAYGHGERGDIASGTQQDIDQLALDRRVTVTFYRDGEQTVGVAATDTDQ